MGLKEQDDYAREGQARRLRVLKHYTGNLPTVDRQVREMSKQRVSKLPTLKKGAQYDGVVDLAGNPLPGSLKSYVKLKNTQIGRDSPFHKKHRFRKGPSEPSF